MPKTQDALVCYAANASSGRGGQGEFLRQMVYALDQVPHARILSRHSQARRAQCIDLPTGGWRGLAYRTISRLPLLRRRADLMTLINDVDFDARLAPHVRDVHLLDAVMGQCSRTFADLRGRVPLVLTALNCHIDTVAELLQDEYRRLGIRTPSFIHPRMRERVRREVANASHIRVISDYARRSFVDRGIPADQVETILPAVDLDHFRPVAKKNDGVFRVLAVLTIDPRKGAYYLLEAFEKAAIAKSELVIIGATGDPWSRQMLGGFLARSSNIRIQAADVLKEPIESTYGQASVFVHPAIEDGFALAVAQAMACGKPVITTPQTGASQLIVDGQNGYVVPCRDVDAMVELLRKLAQDEALLSGLSAAAPSAAAGLGYPDHAQSVIRMYQRMLAA